MGRIQPKQVSLGDHLAVVVATLGEPQERLRLDTISLTLDRMGVRVTGSPYRSVDKLQFNEFSTSDGRRARSSNHRMI